MQTTSIECPSQIDDLLCSALRRESPPWPWTEPPTHAFTEFFTARCTDHGVQVLLDSLAASLQWPATVLARIHRHALAWAVWESRHRSHVAAAFDALAAEDIHPIVFKGSALAYTVYQHPYHRPRADTDLLIPANRRRDAARILSGLGLRQKGSIESEFVSYEASFLLDDASGSHLLDVHWRIHYSQMQGKLISYDRLRSHSLPIEALGIGALAPDAAHCVIIGCLHRANDLKYPLWHDGAAHFGMDRLVWRHDLHLLLQSMDDGQAHRLCQAMTETGLTAICGEAIARTVRAFGTSVPALVADLLSIPHANDPIGQYHDAPTLKQKWVDFNALKGARSRIGYLLDHLLPPFDYMRGRYPQESSSLASLRMRRIYEGVTRSGGVRHPQ